MENNLNPTPEEMQKLIEKAKADLKAQVDKMTPEERREAALKAKQAIADDNAEMERLINMAHSLSDDTPAQTNTAPNFCSNCGAPAGGGNFCTYCDSPFSNR